MSTLTWVGMPLTLTAWACTPGSQGSFNECVKFPAILISSNPDWTAGSRDAGVDCRRCPDKFTTSLVQETEEEE
jgi:hypothetical protein